MTHYCCTFLVYKICLEKVSLLTDFLKVCFTPKSFILFPTAINCTHALPFIFVDCYRKVNIELLNHCWTLFNAKENLTSSSKSFTNMNKPFQTSSESFSEHSFCQ